MPTVECHDPHVFMSNQGGFSGGGSSQLDAYTACVYAYAKGTSVQIVLISTTQHPTGLQGLVNRAVKRAFGGNEETAERYLDQIDAKLRQLVPAARLVRSSKGPR